MQNSYKQPSIWEQRELLSFDYNINHGPTNELVEQIVVAIIKNQPMEWDTSQLSLVDEALIQKKLRDKNIELLCYNLDLFPTSTDQLALYIKKIPLGCSRFFKKQLDNIKFYIINYYPLLLATTVLLGIIYYRADLLLESLLASWLICNLTFIVMHEYWAHNYIEPKSKLISYILDVIVCVIIMLPTTPRKTVKTHIYHHRFFHGPQDNIQFDLDHNNWFNYIFNYKMKTNAKLNQWLLEQSDNDFAVEYKKLDRVQKFLEDHTTSILIVTHIMLLIGLGLHYYLYFVLVPILFYKLIFFYFSEVLTHKIYKDDRDMPWAYPIVLNTAYHNTHHMQINKLVLGPKILRYLNPQYYFIRIFFKVNAEII
jgi:hypothetical protein